MSHVVQHSLAPAPARIGCELEHGADSIRPAGIGRAIKIAGCVDDDAAVRISPSSSPSTR